VAIAGKGGNVKIGAAMVGEVNQWKLDISNTEIDTTNFGSAGWKTYIAGLNEWSGSFDANWIVETDTTGQVVIQNAILAGTITTLEFDVDGTHHYSGSALIKKFSVDTSVKGQIKLTVDFQGTGALTYA
jgi:predicted secreted protein